MAEVVLLWKWLLKLNLKVLLTWNRQKLFAVSERQGDFWIP
jgi:hypothetical protein